MMTNRSCRIWRTLLLSIALLREYQRYFQKKSSLIFITSLPRGVDSMALRTVLGETTALEWFSKSLSLITADETNIQEEAKTNYL